MDTGTAYPTTELGLNEKAEAPFTYDENITKLDDGQTAYLTQRHGTIELDPLPSADPQDPLNWPNWRKNIYLAIFSFHGFIAVFMAAGLVPATEIMSKLYERSPSDISYLVSAQIALFGVTPFIWLPIMERVGRRPSLMASVLGATVCNIGGAFCKTYGQQMATRCLTAIFISPPCALGSQVVTELFFSHQRGAKTSLWKFMFSLGAPAGPFVMGFVAERAGLRWLYFTFAIVTFAVFLAYLLLTPETLYNRQVVGDPPKRSSLGWVNTLKFRHIDTTPPSLRDLYRVFKLLATVRIILPILVYAIVFAYANIALIVTMPQVFGEKFHLDAEGVGLQFISLIIGLILGEAIGGRGSDLWMKKRAVARGGKRVIEDRLWLAYVGLICVVVGLVVWGVRMQQATPGRWNVTPDIGAAIASFGCQLVTTALVTYAIDVNPKKAAETGLLLNLIRQEWGFIGPFYFPAMFSSLGFGGAGIVMAGVIGVCGSIPILIIHFTRIGCKQKRTVVMERV